MRIHPQKERSLRRIAALALCVASAALLSGCETYQDARSDYHDFYSGPVPGSSRHAHYVHHETAPARRVAVRDDDDIAPRARPAYVPPVQHEDSAGQQTHLGDPLAAGFAAPVSGRIIESFGQTGSGQRNDGINISAATGTMGSRATDALVRFT